MNTNNLTKDEPVITTNFNLSDIEEKTPQVLHTGGLQKKLTLDGLIDTGALTSAITKQDFNKSKLLADEAMKVTGPRTNFQFMVANRQLEVPIGTLLLEVEVADFMIRNLHYHEKTTKSTDRIVFPLPK